MSVSTRPHYISIGDSSTVVVRGIGALLHKRDFDPFCTTPIQKIGASLCNRLPKSTRKFLMERMTGSLGVDFNQAKKIRSDDLAEWVVSEYPQAQYDSVIIGVPSGGVGHLASYLGAPFLTQHFLAGFKGKFPIDDSDSYLAGCEPAARKIVQANSDLHAIIHYDPLHDRFIVKRTGFIRVKLLFLHKAYREFLLKSLKPGGTIVLVGCSFPWLQYQISARVNFQLGGLGGVTPDEYYNGSDRIEEYINLERRSSEKTQTRVKHESWLLSKYKPENHPESEWGLLPSFADDVRNFADSQNFRIVEIMLDHPDQLSEIMFNAFGNLIANEHPDKPRKILIDSFTNSSPAFNRKISAQPLWLPFICDDSFNFAKRILDSQPEETQILLALHPSFADPFDIIPLEKWMEYLSRFKEINLIGVDKKNYPADLTAYYKFSEDINKYASTNPCPLKAIKTIDELQPYINSVL